VPSFTLKIPNLVHNGPLVNATIALTTPLFEAMKKKADPIPEPVKVMALIDTGATSSVVAPDVITRLGIFPTGSVKVNTPSCSGVLCNQYTAAIVLPNNIIIETTNRIEAPLQGQPIQCLLGRDILSQVVLIYNGYAEEVTFSI
jgi:predicted aspartyl protease